VERAVPITESNPAKSKRALYRITDPYVAFWHRFVGPMVSAGSIGLAPPAELWAGQVEPRLDDYLGSIFEAACRQFVRRGTGLPFRPLRVGEWWDADSRNQVDVVAIGGGGELLVGECKWGSVRGEDLQALRSRAELVMRELKGVRTVHLAVFAGREIAPSVRAEVEAGRCMHFALEDLYPEST
jgi:AAA+ ATPase superfamily predicted ATPase